MKWLGSILICCGGFWWWRLCLDERRRQRRTLEQLLAALHQLREGIRMARLPLPWLLEQLAVKIPYFARVLSELQQNEVLPQAWERAAEELALPPESRAVWCWLGGQLIGDVQYVTQAISRTERVLEREVRRMAEQRVEADRRTAAVCFSSTALLVILLL